MAMSQARKSLLTMLGMLVAAGAVGAYAYYGVYKGEEAKQKQEEQSAKIFEFDKTKVKSVSLQSKGNTSTFDKAGSGWKISAPVEARADKSSVEAIIDKLADLKAKDLNEQSKGKLPPQYLVSDSAADVTKYGFDQPQWSASVLLDDGKQYSLQVGAENAFDKSLYFRRADESKVYLGDSGLKHPLDKTLFDLRDKAIVTHEDNEVMAISVQANGVVWAAEREGDGWKLTAPVQDRADKQTVEGVLARIHSVRAKAFPAESLDPKDADKYGFTKPTATIMFAVGADRARKTLIIGEGGAEPDKPSYAHIVEGGAVEEIDPGLVKDLVKTPNELRDRTVLLFPRDPVTKIEVIPASGEKFVVNRAKEKATGATYETDKFTLEGRPDKLKTWKMSAALHTLTILKAGAIADEKPKELAKYGLDKPAFTYVVTSGPQEVARLLLGNPTPSGTRYYAKTATGERVYEIEKAQVNELPKTVDEILDAPTPATDAGTEPAAPEAPK